MDSLEDEAELQEEEPPQLCLKKKKTKLVHSRPPPPPPTWAWVPGHYEPAKGLAPLACGGPWEGHYPPPMLGVTTDSEDRVSRRKRKAAYDLATKQRATAGVKPNRVFVLPGGEVDASCEGKNAWDKALRDLVPKCLDMSVIAWKKHDPQRLKKLRSALDNEFEYVGNPLNMVGFRVAIMKFLKVERFQLKNRYLQDRDRPPPLRVDDDEWERLKEYWNTKSEKKKAKSMAAARQSVKSNALVGRKGKAAKEAPMVSVLQILMWYLALLTFPYI